MMDLAERLHGRVQLTTDGLAAYLSAVEDAFGADVDYSANTPPPAKPGPKPGSKRA